MPNISDLRQRQALPLEAKVHMTQIRIREWYNHWDGDVYVAFSGGKDSTVLAHLVKDMYPNVPLVYSNTGLEYPEIQAFARKMGAEFVRPKMQFSEVISKYGYPLIGKEVAYAIWESRKIGGGKETIRRRNDLMGKRQEDFLAKDVKDKVASPAFNKTKWINLATETNFLVGSNCCHIMKKTPLKSYETKTGNKPYAALLAEESRLREQLWLKYGCNAFDVRQPMSRPMSFWYEQDILHYIKDNNLEICSVYGDILASDDTGMLYEPLPGIDCKLKCSGCQRTGCIFCAFGTHLEKGETRFKRLSKTHPKQYEYCMMGGQWVDNPKYDPSALKMDGDWKNWNPKKIWVPSKEGLGMKKVFDDCNQIYGKDFIKYE